jgi:hypothetical protein
MPLSLTGHLKHTTTLFTMFHALSQFQIFPNPVTGHYFYIGSPRLNY